MLIASREEPNLTGKIVRVLQLLILVFMFHYITESGRSRCFTMHMTAI